MQFKSDTEIKKWRPKGNNTRVRCGPKLYVRGFETGRKLFQLRFEVSRKTNWLDVADYPAMSLAVAREMAIAAGRLIKAKDCTVESLRVALTRSDSARSLESRIKANNVTDQPTSTVQTFDEAFRDWYKAVAASNRWKNLASERRPIRSYELHAEKHIGTLPLDKIRRPAIKAFMQPLFTSNPEVAGKLLGYMNKVFLTAFTDEVIEANPCPPKEAFIIPEKNVRHAASLNFSDLPKLMEWLRKAPFSQPVKTAMRLTVVTAHRASVISYMRWEHLDLETGIWTIPQRKEEDRTLGLMKSKDPSQPSCHHLSCRRSKSFTQTDHTRFLYFLLMLYICWCSASFLACCALAFMDCVGDLLAGGRLKKVWVPGTRYQVPGITYQVPGFQTMFTNIISKDSSQREIFQQF